MNSHRQLNLTSLRRNLCSRLHAGGDDTANMAVATNFQPFIHPAQNTIPHTLKVFAILLQFLIFANFAATLQAQEKPREISVCFYDLDKFTSEESPERKTLLEQFIKGINPDILVLSGVKDLKTFAEIKKFLPDAKFAKMIEAEDKERHIAIISKIQPQETKELTDLKYSIKDLELPVKRGFLYCLFKSGEYSFHLIAADLKNRDKVEGANQTDMRRYEARLLRYYVSEIIKENTESNIMIAADLNDTCGMAPVKEVYNRRFNIIKKLYDIRPLDSLNTSWTHWNSGSDDYERIDYLIATSSLLPEISREKTRICENNSWDNISSHRPIVGTIVCKDQERWTKEKLDSIYPNAIYEGPAGHFEEDKTIGDKPKRNPPTKNKE